MIQNKKRVAPLWEIVSILLLLYMLVLCPHCLSYTMIEQLNCRIFRHGIFKDGSDVSPHSTKEDCDRFIALDLIWGCGKPFQIIGDVAVVCEYI